MSEVAELPELLSIARSAAKAASALLATVGRDVGDVKSKSTLRDLVTEWDTRTEDLIRKHLAPTGISILGEEGGISGPTEKQSGDCWLVDPIDGTYNFAHRLPIYATSIALKRDGEPVIGVVAAPALGYEFYAATGIGAFLNERPIAVSNTDRLDKSMLATGFPANRAETKHNFSEWEYFQRHAGACRRLGAASLDLAFVACGWLEGYWETQLSPWDIAAGAVLVREAGGRVTDITGEAFRVRSGNAIASNGAIHKEIAEGLQLVGKVIGDRGKNRGTHP